MSSNIPFSFLTKSIEYIRFLKLSKNRHAIHSPFVFNFIENVLRKKWIDKEIEEQRKLLLKDRTQIYVEDHGVGSSQKRSIASIAIKSLKKKKEATLISRICNHFAFDRALELGTSLGITSAYLARSRDAISVTSIEGSEEVLNKAREVWKNLGIENILAHHSDFDTILPSLLDDFKEKSLFFIDGNHSFDATARYFDWITEKIHPESIVIVDDIYWSEGMKKVWQKMKADENVSLSIDLFEMGILFFDKRLKKEHFILRY